MSKSKQEMFYVVSFPKSTEPDKCTILNDEEFSLCMGDITFYYRGDYNACKDFKDFMDNRNKS